MQVRVRVEQRPRPAPDWFEALYQSEYGRLVAVANRVLDDLSEAEDVAQEALWELHRRHPGGLPHATGWLHRAAVHTALNRLRGRRRRERRERALDPRPAEDPEVLHLRAEERRLVRAALDRISRKHAAVLALRYSGLSYAEVALALGVGTGQIGTLLKRAEAALAAAYAKETNG